MENVSTRMNVGNGKYTCSQKGRREKMMIIASNGKKTPITLMNILYVPEMLCNWFSTTKARNQGFDDVSKARDKKIAVSKTNF